MRFRIPAVDPESFRGKLCLLVLDKVVIGALVAIAFLVYDRWKTEEVRRYTAVQEETQLGFKRAEYVKQLVPIVLDSKQDVQYRAHALGALVETKSIDANAAVNFAQKLLESKILASDTTFKKDVVNPINKEVHHFVFRSETAKDYFLETMLKAMPSGLPALLKEFRLDLLRVTGQDSYYPRYLSPAGVFWETLFWKTISQYKDSELSLLDSDRFLVENIRILYLITDRFATRSQAEGWSKRKVKGLRIIGSINLFQSSREPNTYALSQLESTIDPMLDTGLFSLRKLPDHDPDALKLATATINLLREHNVGCPGLSDRLLAIILRRQDFALHRKELGGERSPMEDRFHAASEYLVSCAGYRREADRLESSILPVVREFYEKLKKTPSDTPLDLNYPKGEMFKMNYPIEWRLIRFLVKANKADPSPEAERLLSELFSLSGEKRGQGGLGEHVGINEWKNARISMMELVGVWKDVDGYFQFKPDGTFGYALTRAALSAGRLDNQGTISLKGNAFTFESENVCGKQKGVYRLEAKTDSKLTFTKDKEDCSQRRLVFLERAP